MKKTLFFLLLLSIIIDIKAQVPEGYYDNVQGFTGPAMKTALNSIIKGHTQFPYTATTTDTWDILKLSDKDPANSANVILIYSATSVNAAQEWNNGNGWTREHVWSKSHGDFGTTPGAGTDCHHLRPESPPVNSSKGDRDFAMGGIPHPVATGCYYNSTPYTWEPRDAVKGDVARMVFYMATRYLGENGEPFLQMVDYTPSSPNKEPRYSKLSDLLQWNMQDPPDEFERNRNEVVYSYQHNRNPFVDHYEWINHIWGNGEYMGFTTFPMLSATAKIPYITNIKFKGFANDTLTIGSIQKPEWLTLEQLTDSTATLYGTPLENFIGENVVKLSLTNGDTTITTNFKIIVSESLALIDEPFGVCPSPTWTSYSVTSNKNWVCGSGYMEANGYGGDVASNDWLISPRMDLTVYPTNILSFKSYRKYYDVLASRLKCLISTNYKPGQNPENYTWQELTYYYPIQNSGIFENSGDIDISQYASDSVYVAFQYKSSGVAANSCETWRIDDVKLLGKMGGVNIEESKNKKAELVIFPNPATNFVLLQTGVDEVFEMNIYNSFGKIVIHEKARTVNGSIQLNVENFKEGIYIAKLINSKYSLSDKFIINK